MPINIPDQLPAGDLLKEENVFVMTEERAMSQHVRPLKVIILNLMPKKIETENQLIRLLSNTPLQVDVELLRVDNRVSKNTPEQHLEKFYRTFEQIKDHKYDGLIITGAPLGLVQFEDVLFWDHIEEIIRWSKTHVTSTLFLCWAVQAGLKVFYNCPKKTRKQKLSGVYLHNTQIKNEPLTRGFDDDFLAPHSRYADFPVTMIESIPGLKLMVSSPVAGAYLFASDDKRQVYVTGHPEYDATTLANEYFRDISEGLDPDLPVNYFPDNNPDNPPHVSWRSHGNLLVSNWLNYYVYQITPFDLESGEMTLD